MEHEIETLVQFFYLQYLFATLVIKRMLCYLDLLKILQNISQ